MNVISQMAVIGLIALVGLAFIFLSRSGIKMPLTSPKPVINPPGGEGVTMFPPVLYVDQLNPQSMKLVKRFEVHQIPAMGVTISRPNAASGTIKLSSAVKSAFSVSANHVCIGRDDRGLFIQDVKNDGRMRLGKNRQVVDEVDITDGLMLYVGIQPLRFVIPDLWSTLDEDENVTKTYGSGETRNFAPEPDRFVRRRR